MLLAEDIWGSSVWQRALLNGQLDVLQKLREWAEKHVTKEEIKNWPPILGDGTSGILQQNWPPKENLTKGALNSVFLLTKG